LVVFFVFVFVFFNAGDQTQGLLHVRLKPITELPPLSIWTVFFVLFLGFRAVLGLELRVLHLLVLYHFRHTSNPYLDSFVPQYPHP
jgi:hypothetical protein